MQLYRRICLFTISLYFCIYKKNIEQKSTSLINTYNTFERLHLTGPQVSIFEEDADFSVEIKSGTWKSRW